MADSDVRVIETGRWQDDPLIIGAGEDHTIAFGVDDNGNWGFIKDPQGAGADTVIPFNKKPHLLMSFVETVNGSSAGNEFTYTGDTSMYSNFVILSGKNDVYGKDATFIETHVSNVEGNSADIGYINNGVYHRTFTVTSTGFKVSKENKNCQHMPGMVVVLGY